MSDFASALADPAIPFLRYALFAGLLSSIAFGIIGTYVVTRRISYLAGAMAHCVLGGIGAALYLQQAAGWSWLHPRYGAAASALLAAVVLGLVSLYAREREDTAIGALWAIGMAIGLLFLAKTPGYVDPMSYLFGNILMISKGDLALIAVLDFLIVCLAMCFHNRLLAVCFDEEFARLRGVHTERYYLLLLCLTALTVVLLASVVGIIMVVALLTLPAAIAGQYTRRLWRMMALAVLLCMVFTSGGLAASYRADLPSGPTIIIIAGAVYLATAAAKRLRGTP